MFRHFYLQAHDESEFDAIEDGSNACAFFVSSVLTIFQKLKAVHGTVNATILDLEESGWQTLTELRPGDVIIWEATAKNDGHQHIGIYVGDNQAVSTSTAQRKVAKHDIHFDDDNRAITHIYRMNTW
jgi:hypothetical protein